MEDGPGGKGGYVPPHLRNRDGGGENKEEQQATLRVTNVSTDATRDDMHELFRRYTPLSSPCVCMSHHRGGMLGLCPVQSWDHDERCRIEVYPAAFSDNIHAAVLTGMARLRACRCQRIA